VADQLTMPKLSDSMADAVIIKWLKTPGQAFARGEGLIEVETDKATVVYEAESDGTLGAILVAEGETAAVGEPIATLSNGEGAPAGPSPPPAPAPSEPAPVDGGAPARGAEPAGELDRWRERDPIVVLRAQLEAEGVEPDELDEIERDMTAQLERMRESGLAAPFPTELTAREFKD